MKKQLVTEEVILQLHKSGKSILQLEKGALITPAAMDVIKQNKIKIEFNEKLGKNISIENREISTEKLKIAVGSDHTGFIIKEELKRYIKEVTTYEINDVGTFTDQACDYPDFAFQVAKLVSLKEAYFGILFDATGIPSAIAANKVPGIRAVTCYNEFSARSSREHNNANILVLGARTLGIESIKAIIKVWFNTSFLGERHQKRIDKITEIEKQFLLKGL
jgi:ribose 5-phosphate isomerase B